MGRRFICSTCLVLCLAAGGRAQFDKGNVLFEYYWGTGARMDTLPSLPSFPDSPDESELRAAFEGRANWKDNYGTRARGYLIPSQTGDFTFWIASDDNSELWLSPDEDPANAVIVATVQGQTNSRQWDKYADQKSAPIRLQSGRRYYIEALHAEGTGRDNLAVAWAGPGIGAEPVLIDGAFLSPPSGLTAADPVPRDGAESIRAPVMLEWTPGRTGLFHQVYVGTSPTLDSSAPTIERYHRHYVPKLVPATTYYWRVDEIESDGVTKHVGPVWSFSTPPLIAHNPDPPDNARFVDLNADLSWDAGAGAIAHDVYLGTSETAVANATKISPEFKAYQLARTFDPGVLATSTAYYWRVDEVEADGVTRHKGDVWRFATVPEVTTIVDPDLIGWWKCDEGPGGRVAIDWSGHGNDGVLKNGPRWMAQGRDGGALRFDGDDGYVAIKNLSYSGGGHTAVSVCAWIRTSSEQDQYIVDFDNSEYWTLVVNYTAGPGEIAWIVGSDTGEVRCHGGTRIDDGQWHHVVGVFDNGKSTLYIDGTERSSTSGGPTFGDPWGFTRYGFIGAKSEATGFDGKRGTGSPVLGEIDDVRIYRRALMPAQIGTIMNGDPVPARNPSPASGSTVDLEDAVLLSCGWSPGELATGHNVYLGTDEFAVAVADTSDLTGIYRGRQTGASYTAPESLEFGRTYFWRVDETSADGTVFPGRVWNFTLADYLIVDDFESYDDFDDRIFYTWLDGWGYSLPAPGYPGNGTGSTVGHIEEPFAERTLVHGGEQAMPMEYLNDGSTGQALYSEAERIFDSPEDWTRYGVDTLALWIKARNVASSSSFALQAQTGIYTMTSNGYDMAGESDQMNYVCKLLSGGGSITAKVLSVAGTHDWAKAGVMIRETLDPNSAHAMVVMTPARGLWFGWRKDKGEVSESYRRSGIRTPQWVKLERLPGNVFNAYYSADGSTWTQAGSPVSIPMADTVYVGLVLSSRDRDLTCMAELANVTVEGAVFDEWQRQDIGMAFNAVAPLYVTLQDSNSRTATVKHANPSAVTTDTWQEWSIDLAAFNGVDMRSVRKMIIGVGDRAHPQSAGSGGLYIDDIRLYP